MNNREIPMLSRMEKRKKAQKKRRIIAAALVTALSVSTYVGVEASGLQGIPMSFLSNHIEEAVSVLEDTPANDTEKAEEQSVASRTSKNRVWLNPDQAVEGQEAPLFIALCFHEVRNDRPNDNLAISTSNFRKIIRDLKSQGYWFLDSNDIIAIKKGEMKQPEKAVFLSFDDGYLDNYTNAFPIIRQEGVKATFFLVSGSIGKDNRMTVAQLKEMAAYGMCFGSHTVNHEELDKLSPEQIQKEMNDSKYTLEHDYGITVESIAYPCGYESDDVINTAKDNYEIGFTANMDEKVPETPYTIHRYGVFRWHNSLKSIAGEA